MQLLTRRNPTIRPRQRRSAGQSGIRPDGSPRRAPPTPRNRSPVHAEGAPPPGSPNPAPRPEARRRVRRRRRGAAPELKAPAQWKPEARERWAGAIGESRRKSTGENASSRPHLQQSAGLRDFVGAFENIVRPYEMFIRAENSSPLAAVANLFQTAAALRVETPRTKRKWWRVWFQQYAIDLDMLDTARWRAAYGVTQPGPNGQQAMAQQAPTSIPGSARRCLHHAT
jgi:hypothetical protein